MGTLFSREHPFAGANNSSTDPSQQNTINELQILHGHTDIIRLLIKLDDNRFASASDDCTINIWNFQTGKKVFQLQGHTRPITCLLLLDRHTLVSGSSDKSIRLWDLATGTCVHRLSPAHTGSVQCLALLEQEEGPAMFCSGGNDQELCIWECGDNSPPKRLGTIERKEEENLHCLLSINNQRIVTGSNSTFLYVYNTDKLSYVTLLAYHRESVRCLINISDKLFASGALDGSIVVWQSETLNPLKILEFPEKYFQNHNFPFSVNHMMTISENYVCVAIGNGFRVYDVISGHCVLECQDAHDATLQDIICLYGSTRIVTCSADSCIRVWGAPLECLQQSGGKQAKNRFGRQKANVMQAVCLGEMWGHTDSVNALLHFSDDSFVSCGADAIVVIWKDGNVQSELRNQVAAVSLIQHNLEMEPDIIDEGWIGWVEDDRFSPNNSPNSSPDRSPQEPNKPLPTGTKPTKHNPSFAEQTQNKTQK